MPSAARTMAFMTSGERDSCVEHMVHVDRLRSMQSVQFNQRHAVYEAPPPSSAMLDKHTRRATQEEDRIRRENHILWEKIEAQARYGERLRRDALAKLKKQGESYAGSNIHRRTLEAKRIDAANQQLYERIAFASPRIAPRAELESSAEEQRRRARMNSRFRPIAEFVQPERQSHPDDEYDDEPHELAHTPRAPDAGTPRSARTGGGHTPRLPAVPGIGRGMTTQGDIGPGWNGVTRDDVKRTERARDRKLKGHPPLRDANHREPATSGAQQRSHNPSGWCDRDAAHKQHVERVRREAELYEEEEEAAEGVAGTP